jgi:molybdopterin converting factor subunit 1
VGEVGEWREIGFVALAGRVTRAAGTRKTGPRRRYEGSRRGEWSVRVVVRLFAILRERAGTGEFELDLPAGATVATAAERLGEVYPAVRDHARHVAYAVNREYVGPTTQLRDGDELAVIPPVSGG